MYPFQNVRFKLVSWNHIAIMAILPYQEHDVKFGPFDLIYRFCFNFFLFGYFRSGTCLLLDRRPTVLWPIILQRETLRSHSQFSSDSHTYTELWVFKKKLPQNEYKLSMQTTRVDLYAYIYESKLQNFHPSDYCLHL